MLTKYIGAAMRRATYEILPDGTFYGEIPDSRASMQTPIRSRLAARTFRTFLKDGSFLDYDWGTRCP